VAAALALTAGGFLALSLGSALPFWLSAALAPILVVLKWHTQPLVTLTKDQVTLSRVAEGGALAILFALIFN